ncbi:MAG: MogA/MoaB family molybdenum cofactor biosynthesis protein [Methanothrix sp.]|nr:MogA/MoaB family molybdenum cofactor biosynthesis protein [Methanothrix sp.]
MIIDVVVASTSRFSRFGSVRSPEEADDLSGQLILEKIRQAGHTARYALLPDGLGLRQTAEKSKADALIICGGTGLTGTDLTLEAVEPLFEKSLPGFGEIFRYRSLEEVGTRAMLTRAAAGIHNGRPIFCLPGSPGAARLGMDLILPELGHIIGHIRE